MYNNINTDDLKEIISWDNGLMYVAYPESLERPSYLIILIIKSLYLHEFVSHKLLDNVYLHL